MTERFAIYFAPPATSELWQRAARWLGRDAATGAVSNEGIAGISGGELTALTPSAARYGFHATIKAPMALAEGSSRQALEAALRSFAEGHDRLSIGRLELRLLDGFLALTAVTQGEALTDFAGKAVVAFDPFRRPMDAAERTRRINSHLSPYQIELLDRYGYPYVLDQFLFHMTLTDRLPADRRDQVMAAAAAWFGPGLDEEVILDRLCLYHQPEAGAPFERCAEFPLGDAA